MYSNMFYCFGSEKYILTKLSQGNNYNQNQ